MDLKGSVSVGSVQDVGQTKCSVSVLLYYTSQACSVKQCPLSLKEVLHFFYTYIVKGVMFMK